MPMRSIEVDPEVFAFLQKEARPFLDEPNDVLRRVLLDKASRTHAPNSPDVPHEPPVPRTVRMTADADAFVREVLSREFGAGFKRSSPYRMMFEDAERMVYFQNFSKEANHLWYRINTRPWTLLRSGRKHAWVCLTNPVERYAYLVPIADINERVHRAGWSRDYLEVNIDPSSSRWTELDWDLSGYRKALPSAA